MVGGPAQHYTWSVRQACSQLERYLAARHACDRRLGADAPLFAGRAGGRLVIVEPSERVWKIGGGRFLG